MKSLHRVKETHEYTHTHIVHCNALTHQSTVAHVASKLRARMDLQPPAHVQEVLLLSCCGNVGARIGVRRRCGHVLLAERRSLQQLVDVGNVAASQRLAGRDPEGVLRTVPVGLDEHAAAQIGNGLAHQSAKCRKRGRFGVFRVVVVVAVSVVAIVGVREAAARVGRTSALLRQNEEIGAQIVEHFGRNRQTDGRYADLLECRLPSGQTAGSLQLLIAAGFRVHCAWLIRYWVKKRIVLCCVQCNGWM